MAKKNDASIGAKVDEDTKHKIRMAAAMNDMTMSEYLREAVLAQLEEDIEEGNPSQAMATLS